VPEQQGIDWEAGAKARQKQHRQMLDELGMPPEKDYEIKLDPKYAPKTEGDRYTEVEAPALPDNPQEPTEAPE